MLHRRQIGDHERHHERADRRRCAHPTEPDRAAVQNLIGKNRKQRGSSAEQDRKQIERDRRQNYFPAKDETNSSDETAPRIFLRAFAPRLPRPNRQNEQEKHKRAECIEHVNKREADVGDEQDR